MASIINSISFKNFFNYYGEYDENTTYEFKEGINIIVADNGAGKSKLFNSLLWIFKDKVDTTFDFSWHPDDTEPAYIYQFPSTWSKTGGPKFTVEGASETKY